MIRLGNVTKTFKDGQSEKVIFENVNMEIPYGLILIMGASGIGKTTLLNIIGGLLEPTGGQVDFEKVSYYKLSKADQALFRKIHFGYVFQDFFLIEDMSIVDNIMLAMNKKNAMSKKREQAKEALVSVGLGSCMDRSLKYLSGGERQRVAIARAIADQHNFIFCDEPTGNLDQETSEEIMGLLRDIASNRRTVFVVSHDKSFMKYADYYISVRPEKVEIHKVDIGE